MLIIQDQREKHGHHNNIEEYCKQHDIPIIRKRLEVGDYMLGTIENGVAKPIGKRSVDLKGGGMLETANDLYRDKKEFNKKYKKCLDNGIQLYVLVEQEVKSLSDILSWSSPHSKISGKMLYDMIDRVRKSYGVKFVFCKKEDVGRMVVDILSP
jgi:predicted peroxiredoxin